jgi:hypothetical protein
MSKETFFTNKHGLPQELCIYAEYIYNTGYDYKPDDEFAISVTSLLKPIQAIVLARLNKELNKEVDFADIIASANGTAMHYHFEQSLRWYNENNPDKEQYTMEIRNSKKIGRWTVSGKFDLAINGYGADLKTTSVYKYMSKDDSDYINQISYYRWLHPEHINKEDAAILFLFTDWKNADRLRNPREYPSARGALKLIKLKEPSVVEAETIEKIKAIDIAMETGIIPECSMEELWATPTLYKVYKTVGAAKAMPGGSKFENIYDAQDFCTSKGVPQTNIKEVKGTAKRCNYCEVRNICPQATKLSSLGYLN